MDSLKTLLVRHAVRRGRVALADGGKSDWYCDCRRVLLQGDGAHLAGRAMVALLDRTTEERIMFVGGPSMGADPLVTAMVIAAYPERALHGFLCVADGEVMNPPRAGARVAIVDDVVTSGRSMLRAVETVRGAGCEVVAALALVDREEGGEKAIRAEVPGVAALYRRSDLC